MTAKAQPADARDLLVACAASLSGSACPSCFDGVVTATVHGFLVALSCTDCGATGRELSAALDIPLSITMPEAPSRSDAGRMRAAAAVGRFMRRAR